MRSRSERMRTLGAIQAALAGIALGATLLAIVVSYGVARTITRPLASITDHMRQIAATGDLTRKIADQAPGRLGRRRRAHAGDDVQHADRFDRALSARGGAARAAVVARPAVDGDRARSAQSADDHQGRAAHAGPRRRHRRRRARCGEGHRRGDRAAEQSRQRRARRGAADPVRSGADRHQRGVPRRRPGGQRRPRQRRRCR